MLTFNFNPLPTISSAPAEQLNDSLLNLQVFTGMTAAGNLWSSLLSDDVIVNIDVTFAPLLDSTGSTTADYLNVPYDQLRSALAADITSLDDAAAISHLPSGPAFNLLINYTQNNPNGLGSPIPYIDSDSGNNNSSTRITRANAKALGLLPGNHPDRDALITFNSLGPWDFDPSDGISAQAYDFVGAAIHEIGHVLGFYSMVDTLEFNNPLAGGTVFFPDDAFSVSSLDLFRFSTDSTTFGNNVVDFTADTRNKYFSLDGVSAIAQFAAGKVLGDGYQASHWKDNLSLGVMDPVAYLGVSAQVSENDLQAFDVIGWNRSLSVPEPALTSLPTPISL